MLILLITAILVWLSFLWVHPFLAQTCRVDAQYLVVEGWIHEFGIRGAVDEFDDKGRYIMVYSTGGPVEGTGNYTNDYKTSASVGASRLRAAGIPSDRVQMVPSRVSDRDRTYGSAVALRSWFYQHNISVSGLNVVTEDVHARRTRLLFQKAFGPGVKIGVIAIPDPDYDAKHWWRYSEGVRNVTSEAIAYLYVTVFFHPRADDREK